MSLKGSDIRLLSSNSGLWDSYNLFSNINLYEGSHFVKRQDKRVRDTEQYSGIQKINVFKRMHMYTIAMISGFLLYKLINPLTKIKLS